MHVASSCARGFTHTIPFDPQNKPSTEIENHPLHLTGKINRDLSGLHVISEVTQQVRPGCLIPETQYALAFEGVLLLFALLFLSACLRA